MPKPEVEEEICPVCYRDQQDLRMLPCWHVSCLTCILGMTQRGQGRAVNCHMCREPCLFENIRSIPLPIRCTICHSFLKNPRKLQCCSRLYCLKCLEQADVSSGVRCENRCTNRRFSMRRLPQVRICRSCLHVHTKDLTSCGHSFCESCCSKHMSTKEGCPVCAALRDPAPVPVNPTEPPAQLVELQFPFEEEINGADDELVLLRFVQKLGSFANSSESQRLQQERIRREWIQDAALDSLEALRELQNLRFSNGVRNPERERRLCIRLFGESYTARENRVDQFRMLLFLAVMFIVGVKCGLDYKIWVIGAILLYLFQMNNFYNWLVCVAIAIALWLVSAYFNFFEHVSLYLSYVVGKRLAAFLAAKGFLGATTEKYAKKCFVIGFAILTCAISSPIFQHRVVLGIVRDHFDTLVGVV